MVASCVFILALLGAPALSSAARKVRPTKAAELPNGAVALQTEDMSETTDKWWGSKAIASAVSQASLDANAGVFTGKQTAYELFCGDWWKNTVRTKIYQKHNCPYGCHSLKVDCNSGPGEGIIKFEYVGSRAFGYFGSKKVINFGAFKNQKSLADGRFLLFARNDEELSQPGCPEWMTQGASAWCEAPKWSQKEDAKLPLLTKGAEWDLAYTWLHFDAEEGVFNIEHDQFSGEREADWVVETGVQSTGLGDGVGIMGPAVEEAADSYTIGVQGFSPSCMQNDELKGTTLPISDDVKCKITVVKVFPMTGKVVKSTWATRHHKTVHEKIFAA